MLVDKNPAKGEQSVRASFPVEAIQLSSGRQDKELRLSFVPELPSNVRSPDDCSRSALDEKRKILI